VEMFPARTCTGSEQNNGNTKKLRNKICVGYTERTSVGVSECSSSVCLHSVVLVSAMLGGSLVATACRVLRLRMEETPSSYGGKLRIY
jgi:hypothetical protein